MSLALSAQISSQHLSFLQRVEDGRLDAQSVVIEAHVSQHHDGGEKESGRVGKGFALNIGGGSVDGFED